MHPVPQHSLQKKGSERENNRWAVTSFLPSVFLVPNPFLPIFNPQLSGLTRESRSLIFSKRHQILHTGPSSRDNLLNKATNLNRNLSQNRFQDIAVAICPFLFLRTIRELSTRGTCAATARLDRTDRQDPTIQLSPFPPRHHRPGNSQVSPHHADYCIIKRRG